MIAAGIRETDRGQVWSDGCREWVYFDCLLDVDALRACYDFGPTVVAHINDDPRSGMEAGLYCSECQDAVIGLHPRQAAGKPVFSG